MASVHRVISRYCRNAPTLELLHESLSRTRRGSTALLVFIAAHDVRTARQHDSLALRSLLQVDSSSSVIEQPGNSARRVASGSSKARRRVASHERASRCRTSPSHELRRAIVILTSTACTSRRKRRSELRMPLNRNERASPVTQTPTRGGLVAAGKVAMYRFHCAVVGSGINYYVVRQCGKHFGTREIEISCQVARHQQTHLLGRRGQRVVRTETVT